MAAQPIGNMGRLRTLVEQSHFDAIIAVSPENVFYTCGVRIGTQKSIRDRLALTVLPKRGEPVLIVCNIEEPQTRTETFLSDVRSYFEFKKSPIALLAEVLLEIGAGSGRIGIETRYLSAHYWKELEAALPGAEVEACDAVFDQARAIKTPAEVNALARAAHNTEKAMLSTYTGVFEGESEYSLVERLTTNLLRSGAEAVEFAYINAGPNTGYPHSKPSAYTCKSGDVLKTDCGASYDGYISDVARTAIVGQASDEQTAIYNRLLEIHHHCIDLVRPGTRACDIFDAMTREHARVGIPFGLTHAGHSVGITGHEHPILNPYDETPLEPDMLFYVETRVRWVGKAGYHIEDLVQVTENGPHVHTGYFDIDHLLEL